jgi:HicA toxin of bacterial toxin-antitoxin,
MLAYNASMNNRQQKTLEAVFAEPTKNNIAWADIEALLIAVGCKVHEGAGSRVKFQHERGTYLAHRPHPQKETKQYAVKYVRTFLIEIGVTP